MYVFDTLLIINMDLLIIWFVSNNYCLRLTCFEKEVCLCWWYFADVYRPFELPFVFWYRELEEAPIKHQVREDRIQPLSIQLNFVRLRLPVQAELSRRRARRLQKVKIPRQRGENLPVNISNEFSLKYIIYMTYIYI